MPLYEFVCQQCQREQELLLFGNDVPKCQACGSTELTKLLSVPAAHSVEKSALPGSTKPEGPCGSGCGCFPG